MYEIILIFILFGGFMKLEIMPRAGQNKSELTRLRREGFIPAVLYVKGKEGEILAVKSSQFGSHLRSLKAGHLPTTVFTLVDSHGKERRAIVKDIQYNITTYDVTHLDLEELEENVKIKVKVPVECTGMDVCQGIKLGGVLRQVIRHLRISCFPKDLPSFFELDIKDLSMGQSKRLNDLEIPETIRPLMSLNEVAAVIVKR